MKCVNKSLKKELFGIFLLRRPKSEAYKRFRAVHGATHRNSSIKTIGCYLLDDGEGNTYVGKSKHISSRIRGHLTGIHKSTRSFLESLTENKAKVTTFTIREDLLASIQYTQKDIKLDTFIMVLEQYLIISLLPNKNKLLVSITGGSEVSFISRHTTKDKIQFNPKSTPIYCYKKENTPEKYRLIHILLSQNSLGKALNKSIGYVNFIIQEQNGWIRDTIYLTKTPFLRRRKTMMDLMSFEEFVNYVQSLLSISVPRKGYSVTVVYEKTGITVGTYPSISYVSKNIIKGANRYNLKLACDRGKAYNGYYIYSSLPQ